MLSQVLKFQTPISLFSACFPHRKLISSIPIKIFGCTTFAHIHSQHRSKLDPKAIKCIFLGYSPIQKGYKCYDPISRKTFVSFDVTFHEHVPFYSRTSLQGGEF